MLYFSENFWNHKDDHTNPMSPIRDIESLILGKITGVAFGSRCENDVSAAETLVLSESIDGDT